LLRELFAQPSQQGLRHRLIDDCAATDDSRQADKSFSVHGQSSVSITFLRNSLDTGPRMSVMKESGRDKIEVSDRSAFKYQQGSKRLSAL
jgi:hypothetical protein